VWINNWDGKRLEALFGTFPYPTSPVVWHSCVFDLSQEPVGDGEEDPLLQGTPNRWGYVWQQGPGWVAYCGNYYPTRAEMWGRWVAARLGLAPAPDKGLELNVRLVDRATGKTRYEFPYPLRHPCFVNQDGRWVTCASKDGGVELWDAEPPVRWPFALAAGGVAAGSVLGIGKWRRRPNRDTAK
jgi:hypothetical protein